MLFAFQQQPVIVRVVEQPVQGTTVAEVLIGAFGLTGALILSALVLGGLFGALLIGIKKLREKYNREPIPDSVALRITPTP